MLTNFAADMCKDQSRVSAHSGTLVLTGLIPTSEPLCRLFPPPRMACPQMSPILLSHFLQVSAQISSPQLPDPESKIAPPVLSVLSLPLARAFSPCWASVCLPLVCPSSQLEGNSMRTRALYVFSSLCLATRSVYFYMLSMGSQKIYIK